MYFFSVCSCENAHKKFMCFWFVYYFVQSRLKQAQLSVTDRDGEVRRVVASIETDLQLLALTGVEDKLQVCGTYRVIMHARMCVCVRNSHWPKPATESRVV